MDTYTLVVSNPPQGEIDPRQAAAALGLSPAEVRMKANYPVPEIWLADADARKMEEAAETLRQAGLNVVVVAGEDLAAVPPQRPVASFEFADAHFLATLEDGDAKIPYDTSIIAVFCTPAERGVGASGRRSGSSLTEGLSKRSSSVFMTRDSLVGFGGLGGRTGAAGGPEEEEGPAGASFLDLYVLGNPVTRTSVLQDSVDFAGLGKHQLPNAAGNLALFVAECEDRFTDARLDRRLVHMQVRQHPMVTTGSPVHGERKGFSYATEALSQLLEAISSDLKDISQFHLSSNLAYLTLR